MGAALTLFEDIASYLDQTLSGRPFLLGEEFTAADIMNGSLMTLADEMDLLDHHETVRNWIRRLRVRPANRRANT